MLNFKPENASNEWVKYWQEMILEKKRKIPVKERKCVMGEKQASKKCVLIRENQQQGT